MSWGTFTYTEIIFVMTIFAFTNRFQQSPNFPDFVCVLARGSDPWNTKNFNSK